MLPFLIIAKEASIFSKLEATGAIVSVSVREAQTAQELYKHQGQINLSPASVQKLITTWVASQKYGFSHRWVTQLEMDGKIENGRLQGNLIIKGGGDPAFGSQFFGKKYSAPFIFEKWLKAIKAKGIREVTGCVLGEGSLIESPSPRASILWGDVSNYYAGVVSGLSFNDNRYKLYFTGGNKVGEATHVTHWEPQSIGIKKFINKIKRGRKGSGDQAYLFGSSLSSVRSIRGTYAVGRDSFFIQGALPHPAWTTSQEFKAFLQKKGIVFNSSKQCPLPLDKYEKNKENLSVIAVHHSPPLSDLISHTNKRSDNNYAEQLLCLLSNKKQGKTGGEGLQAIGLYLKQKGMATSDFHLKDGSGLSRKNWFAASSFTQLLGVMAKDPSYIPFRNTMVYGGTSKNRLKVNSLLLKNLWVKTGTIEGVSALGGFMTSKSGRLLCFYINISHHSFKKIKPKIGQILETIWKTY